MRLLHPTTLKIASERDDIPKTVISHVWSEIFKWLASKQKHPKMFIDDEYNMDNFSTSGNYRTPPSKFYLYHYGVPSFLCESRINSALRYGKLQPDQNFFPNVGDIGDWTQEQFISIRRPNQFYYHSPYSKSVESFRGKIKLSPDYDPEISAKRNNQPNGIFLVLNSPKNLPSIEFGKRGYKTYHMSENEVLIPHGNFKIMRINDNKRLGKFIHVKFTTSPSR
jgi:hypothetical protein